MSKQRKTSHLAKTVLISFAAGWAVILTCSAAANAGLLGKLESSVANLTVWMSICSILLIGSVRGRATRPVVTGLVVLVACSTIAFAIEVTRDVRALDATPLFGRNGANTHLFEDALIAVCTAALAYLFFAALRSVEDAHDSLSLRVEQRTASLREAQQHLEARVAQRTEELAESEERFRLAAEGGLDSFYLLDCVRDDAGTIEDFRFCEVNQRGADMISMTPEQIIGQKLCELLPINRTGGFFDKYVRVVETGQALEEEFELQIPGFSGWLHHQVVPLSNGIAITSLNVTQRKAAEESLVTSELQYRSLVENAIDSILSIVADGTITFANRQAHELFDYEWPDLLGEKIFSLVHAEDRAVFMDRLHRRAAGVPAEQQYDLRMVRRRGDTIWCENSVSSIVDGYDDIGIHLFLRDITPRKRAEQLILENEEFLHNILESMTDGVLVLDADFNYTYWNAAMERLSKLPREEVLQGKHRPWDQFPGVDDLMRRAMQGESVDEEKVPFMLNDDSCGFTSERFVPLRRPNGVIGGVVGVVRDITEQVRLLEAVRESEQRFRTMAEASPAVVWVADENMKLTYINDRWLRFTGRPIEQELGDGWFDRTHPEDVQESLQTIQSAYELRREFELEKRMRRQDGKYRWFHDQAAPRFAEDGQFLGFIGSCVDVTARKQAEEAMRQSDRLASLGTLAAGIAHEINNPMSAAWTAAETARSLNDDDPLSADLLRECLETICDSVRRSQEIIKSVLRLARSESSEKRRCDVNEVVRHAVGAVRYYAKTRNAVIHMELSSPLPHVNLCEAEIEQSLVNLIRNAIQASDKSRVIVTTAKDDGWVRIQVADNGRGIAPTDLGQIFDPFFTKNAGGEGTGLGLALTHQIVKDHGGQIDVTSQIGDGATFTIILPSMTLENKAEEVQV